ncbi:MAG TPA: lipid A biosynthesis acyltransferase [Thiobacillaceae bacterium]|nr:lipid A biosynthesis acyltransferase [Thiobacillaceae bacterium]
MTRLGIALLWLIHWLPLALQAALGNLLGRLAARLARPRRKVVERNLARCFPELDDTQRNDILTRHFIALTRAMLEHGLLFWSSQRRLEKIVRFEGIEHLDQLRGHPVIVLAPHFIGLDMGGVRFSAHTRGATIYVRQRNLLIDRYLCHARSRFNQGVLVSRHEGIRPLIKVIRSGLPFYFLPDQDQGRKESIFVPFFGIQTATVPALSRLAKITAAAVVPAVTRQLPGGQGYVMRFYPAWDNFPSDDVEADTVRMNRFIEDRVREMPEQYLWVHRRFKTRPTGEPPFYD